MNALAVFLRNGNWFAAGYNVCAFLFVLTLGGPPWLAVANIACAVFNTWLAGRIDHQISRQERR